MRRRWLKRIPILVAAMLLFCSFALAEEQAELRLTGVEKEGVYSVTINLIGTDSVEMLQFCLSYDADSLELKQVVVGSAFNDISYPTVSKEIPGKLFFAWDALKPLKAGQLLIAEFTAKQDASEKAAIWIDTNEEFIAANGNYEPIKLIRNTLEIQLIGSKDDGFLQDNPDDTDGLLLNDSEQDPELSENAHSQDTKGENGQEAISNESGKEVSGTPSGNSNHKESAAGASDSSIDVAYTASAEDHNSGLVITIMIAGILAVIIAVYIFMKKKINQKESEVR